jgi:hypothetical protein
VSIVTDGAGSDKAAGIDLSSATVFADGAQDSIQLTLDTSQTTTGGDIDLNVFDDDSGNANYINQLKLRTIILIPIMSMTGIFSKGLMRSLLN